MKLERAIEILTDLLRAQPTWPPDDRRDAVKLGREALEGILFARKGIYTQINELLPGETTD